MYRLFHARVASIEYCGLFDSREDLISKAIVKAKEKNLYHLYSFPKIDVNSELKNTPHIRYINSTEQKDLQDPMKREEIQRYFIENIIFPWMIDHNGALPTNLDYKKTILGVSYSKVFGTKHSPNESLSVIGIFDSMLDLKKKVISLDKDHIFRITLNIKTYKPVDNEHIKYINSTTPKDLKDPQKREQIQRYFIENILFPWIINHNGQYPKISDFKRSILGISLAKLFGYTNRNITYVGIFNNVMDLKIRH